VIAYEEMLKVVVNDYVEQREVYDHMLDWLKRGFLRRAFVDDCYDAVMDGRPVFYHYEPDEYYQCLYPPKGSKMNREEMHALIEKTMRDTVSRERTEGEGL
jgi:hypothetical protein